MRLAARPVGAHNRRLVPLCREDAQNRFDDGGLAHAGTTGHDQHLGGQRKPESGDLTFR
jgi:hypothetical protein